MNRLVLRYLKELSEQLQLEQGLSKDTHEAADSLRIICNILLGEDE